MDDRSAPPRSLSDHLVASAPQGLLVLDPQGRVLRANPAARRILALPRDPGGQPLEALLPGGAGRSLAEAALVPAGVDWTEIRVEVGGAPRLLGVLSAPLAAGVPGASGAVVVSVTDLTRARAREAAARRDAVLAGVSRLARRVAHELRNPVGALRLYALLLGRHLQEAKPEARELGEKIAGTIQRLGEVLSGLAAVGVPDPAAPAPVPLGPLADECLAQLAGEAEARGVRVVRRGDPGVTVSGDRGALRQALLAVLANALEAMPAGGILTVACLREEASAAAVRVEDTGTGLTPEAEARMFEPFFTTKPDRSGLGMSIASHVIGEHGGRVEVRSRPGAGTLVRIVLPPREQAECHGRGTDPGR
jgi:signal transduction histidine kinase